MPVCAINITELDKDDCLGNSRTVINNNFQSLKSAVCSLGSTITDIEERLCSLVPYEGVLNYWGDITLGGTFFDSTGRGLLDVASGRNLTGYALCNGNNGTPDLRDRFIVASGGNYKQLELGPIINTTASMQFSSIQLTIPELPIHDHDVSDPSHTHTIIDNGHTHPYHDSYSPSPNNTASITAFLGLASGWDKNMPRASTTQNKSRTTKSSANISLVNAKTNLTIDNEGGDQRHENRPPYFALAYIMRYR